jgi:hypothetical protein
MTAAASYPSCPRCRSRLRRTSDQYGAYLACLLCGYHYNLTSAAAIDVAAGRDGVPLQPRLPQANRPNFLR